MGGYNHYYERTKPVNNGISLGIAGAGTLNNPFVNPGTMHFIVGTGGQSTEGSPSDPQPIWLANRGTLSRNNGPTNVSSYLVWWYTFYSYQ